MSTKVAIVSGSNKGIGLSIVRALCKSYDGDVFLTSRDESRGQEAVKLLNKEGLNPKFHQLDIESQESIVKLRDFLKANYGGLDVLVNNAGFAFKNDATEPFGLQAEVTNRVNYFGTLNISKELFLLLKPHARVVNVSSLMGHLSMIKGDGPEASELRKRFSDPNLTEEQLTALVNNFVELAQKGTWQTFGWPSSTYIVSKVAVSALTRIQQREIDQNRPNDDILVNSVHPGWVDTDMSSHKGPLSPDSGAVAATWLALLPNSPDSPRGAYVWHDKTIVDWVDGKFPSPF